jgi:two-component system, LuxR family, sensor kinase FixL
LNGAIDTANPVRRLHALLARYAPYVGFVALYLVFDWASYISPLFGLNITPWNPDPALGLVFWLRYGRRAALPWFIALTLGEVLVRGMPFGLPLSLFCAAWLTAGYGLIGAALRRTFRNSAIFDSRRRLFDWVAIVFVGTVVNDLLYISMLRVVGLIAPEHWLPALIRFGIGDIVGITVSMPLIWIVSSREGRARLRVVLLNRESGLIVALALCMLWLVFGVVAGREFKHFYFLFPPIIWASSRQGLYGTAYIAFVLQAGMIAIVKWANATDVAVLELQMLGTVLALVGYFVGIVVDEQRQAAEELKQTLRLAAAGEMAAALAHELNQPMTALSVYGKACEHLLARGDTGPALREAIGKMIIESGRATEVVRRLREFFLSGAMQIETVELHGVIASSARQFEQQFKEHGVQLHIAPFKSQTIHADRLQIELVLRNLLANAFDALAARPPGRRKISISTDEPGDGTILISVEDSGPGVSGNVAARLFEPFVSSKSSGLGLGLVLSRAIVEAHGGNLSAEVADHGIFRFNLPLAEPGEDSVE